MIENITNNHQQIIDDAWLNIVVNESTLFNPLASIPSEFENAPHEYILFLMQQREYLSFVCKEIMGIHLLPMQSVILQEMWHRKFPMLIGSRGVGKSFLLGLYSLLRILLLPSRKIVICGSAFRQSKIIFNYMENIWWNAPLLRDLAGQNSGPRHEPDMYRFHIGDSMAAALPIGDGQKIRGLRANDIIADEFAAQSKDIFENVIVGFGSVRSNPIDSVRGTYARNMARKLGYQMDDDRERQLDNQIILSGTAYYDFNHFAQYWKRWKKIIKSKGDFNRLVEIFGAEEIPIDFDWRDYSIIRIPFELVPRGFMDEAMVARSKATVHSGIYMMEYSSCLDGNTLIVTDSGTKPIKNISIGDNVLTHKGRFRKVTQTYKRPYKDKIYSLNIYGHNLPVFVTPEHPFLQGEDFISLSDIEERFYLRNLDNLNNIKNIDLTQYCSNFVDMRDYLYPQSSQNTLSNIDRKEILERLDSGETQCDVAKSFNISQSAISYIKCDTRKPKNSIPKEIKLDYYFGLCVGYYASEGSIGSKGKTVNFALDGHVDKKLEYFISELSDAIYRVFDFQPKLYNKDYNCISININSRLVGDIFKKICPGDCYNKFVDPNILYSNPDFMRGFIVGIWNGDGHIGKHVVTCKLTSLSLISQIKTVLSYFGIPSSFLFKKRDGEAFIKEKRVNIRDCYILNLHGDNYDKFLIEFYNRRNIIQRRKSHILNNNICSIYNIRSKELVDYDGCVYNLEVDEDHSYSTTFATVHNCFSTDSNGFFKRSLIESCVLSNDNEITFPSGKVWFTAALKGQHDKKYIYGIDPASEVDNFSIAILEHYEDHRRIVHMWTTNAKEHKERVKAGLCSETDFYSYCARKIRDLMKVFPCARIAMDSQGGGVSIREALHDLDKIQEGEVPIWPVIETGKPADTDGEAGLHLIEMINFSSAEWTSEANHGLRKDFEDKTCVFPYFDNVSLGLAEIADAKGDRLYDTLEDCLMEIEELKNELSTIIITQTTTGRDKWSTPEVKLPGNKKGYLRKDRYSALLMANMVSRQMSRNPEKYFWTEFGGFAGNTKKIGGKDYIGPSWLADGLSGIY